MPRHRFRKLQQYQQNTPLVEEGKHGGNAFGKGRGEAGVEVLERQNALEEGRIVCRECGQGGKRECRQDEDGE